MKTLEALQEGLSLYHGLPVRIERDNLVICDPNGHPVISWGTIGSPDLGYELFGVRTPIDMGDVRRHVEAENE